MILFLRFRRATLLLTRGMDRSLHHQQPLEAAFIGLGHQRGLAQVPLPLRVLLGQDVALVGVVPAQPAGARESHALAEGALALLLRHLNPPGCQVSGSTGTRHLTPDTFISAPAPSTYCGPRASGPARSWPHP